jgi:hypothetical protein
VYVCVGMGLGSDILSYVYWKGNMKDWKGNMKGLLKDNGFLIQASTHYVVCIKNQAITITRKLQLYSYSKLTAIRKKSQALAQVQAIGTFRIRDLAVRVEAVALTLRGF